MIEKLYMAVSPWVNVALGPIGCTMWGVFESEDDEHGTPIRFYLRGIRFSRAIRLSSLK